MKIISLIIFSLLSVALNAQIGPDIYLIELTDKNNSPYSIDRPEEYLSDRAIERRLKHNIPLSEQDFPVNPQYLDEIREIVEINGSSRWMNSVTVKITDIRELETLRNLPFVRSIKSSAEIKSPRVKHLKSGIKTLSNDGSSASFPDTSFYNYGAGAHQTGMLKGHILHNNGFRGENMVIAVLDGGFTKADVNPAFDSLWENGQILGGWDFVINKDLTFSKHTHGSQVLSIMGANIPGVFVGTAPKASYYLLRTENGYYEHPLEEENWIRGAEYADSAGADLINSSLSYTRYPDSPYSHTYEDLDGNTTRITIAADIAASKGILVVSSAGNYAEGDWKYIGAPDDGDSVLTVGAVDQYGNYASFSSIGPSADGRIKPNISAMGQGTFFAASGGEIYSGDGTSFSTPIICGLAACLWQSNRDLTNMEILKILENNSSMASSPDYKLGYGLPDFSKCFLNTLGMELISSENSSSLKVFPNPFTESFYIDFYSEKNDIYKIEMWDTGGRMIFSEEIDPGIRSFRRTLFPNTVKLDQGIYIIRAISASGSVQKKVIKQNPNNK